MVPERLLKDIKRLSDADYCLLMTYLERTRPIQPALTAPPRGTHSALAFLRRPFGFLRRRPAAPLPPPVLQTVNDLLKILREDRVDQMADYLRRGDDPNLPLNNLNGQPLSCASSAAMVELLIGAGAEINAASEFGTTAAHWTAREDKRLPALQRLVQAGADLGLHDVYFETPLDSARREKADANARWLESIGAPAGPLANYRDRHPLPRKPDALRPAGQTRMPSLAEPLRDRSALWQHLRELIQFWDPAVGWRPEPALSTGELTSLAGMELSEAVLEFYQSGIFDWLLWKTARTDPDSLRCAWATADAIPRRRVDDFIPVMQYNYHGLYCIEREDLDDNDPVVRYAEFRKLVEVHRCPPPSLHTGSRFSEFVANLVYGELIDMPPARRYFDLESSDQPQAIRLRQELTRCALPRLRSGLGNVQHIAIYEGPQMLYMEIESHYQNQNYYGILAGDSEEALAQIAVMEEVEEEDDWEEDT